MSHIYHAQFQATIEFHLDQEQTDENILDVLAHMDVPALATQKHIEVFALPPFPHGQSLHVPLIGRLPVGRAVMSIAGKEYPALVAGLNGRIIEIEPVLDSMIKPGLVALSKMTKGTLATEALLTTALRYGVIRLALNSLATTSKRQTYQQIIQEYPAILSDKYARGVIRYAETALLHIGRQPRLIGLGAGSAAAAALAGGYFLTPLRTTVLMALNQINMAQRVLVADVLVWVIGYLVSFFAIRFLARTRLCRLLQTNDRALPPAGNYGLAALGITFLIWLLMALAAPAKPVWVVTALALIGQ